MLAILGAVVGPVGNSLLHRPDEGWVGWVFHGLTVMDVSRFRAKGFVLLLQVHKLCSRIAVRQILIANIVLALDMGHVGSSCKRLASFASAGRRRRLWPRDAGVGDGGGEEGEQGSRGGNGMSASLGKRP